MVRENRTSVAGLGCLPDGLPKVGMKEGNRCHRVFHTGSWDAAGGTLRGRDKFLRYMVLSGWPPEGLSFRAGHGRGQWVQR
jgi:hypothetical protein